MGYAHLFSRRFDEAVPKLILAIQDDPSYPQPYRVLAACYAHMGRLDEAREIVKRLRSISPVWWRARCDSETLNTATFSCRACAWH